MGRSLLAGVVLSTTACAPSGPPKLASEGGAAWVELTSPHFILRTDLDPTTAQNLITQLEQIDDALEQVAFPPKSDIPDRVLVVDFATKAEFQAFAPLISDGFMAWKLPNDLEEQSTIVIWGPLDDRNPMSRIGFTHELTHELIHRSFGGAPLWMNEGLAQYFSSVIVRDKSLTLGDLPFGQRLPLPVSLIPTAGAIARSERHEFYAGVSYRETTTERSLQTGAFYEGSWWLVHMLRNGPRDVTARFDKVVAAAEHGESLAEAWNAIMVPDGYRWLNEKFHDYLTIDRLALLHVPYRARASGVKPTRRTMSETETRLLWARLVFWKSEEGGRGLAQLEAAAKHDPNSPEVFYWRAIARLQRADCDGAIELFRAAISGMPNEQRYLLGLALAQSQKYRDRKSAENQAAIEQTVNALEPEAVSPMQLAFLADWYDWKRKRDHAAELADLAIRMNPSCVACVDVRARIAFHDGLLADAVRLEQRAIALLPEGADGSSLQRTLGKYEAELKARPAATPTPAATTSTPIDN